MEKLTLVQYPQLTVSTDEARQWCRIDEEQDEELLERLILAAQQAAEALTARTLSPATTEFRFPMTAGAVAIPTMPVRSIAKVELENDEGSRTLLTSADYKVRSTDIATKVRVLSPNYSQSIVVTAGIGYEDSASVPEAIKQAIALHVGNAYAGREGQDLVTPAFAALLAPYRVALLP